MKLKSHKGTQKRAYRTSGGKLMLQRSSKNHRLHQKSKRQKRLHRWGQAVSHGDSRSIERLIPNY